MDSLSDLKAELQALQDEKSMLLEDITSMPARVNSELSSTVSQLIEAMQGIQGNQAEPCPSDEKTVLLNELAEVNETLRIRGELVSKLNSKISMLEYENEKLKAEPDSGGSRKDEGLHKKLDESEKENKFLKQKIRDMELEIGHDRSSHDPDTMSTSTVSRAEELHRLKDVEDSLEERYNKLKGLAVKLKKKTTEQAVEIASLQNEKKKMGSDVSDLREKLGQVGKEKEAAMKMSQNFKALQESIDLMQDELDAKKKECKLLQKDLDAVVHKGSDAQMGLVEATESVSRLQRDLQVSNQKYADLESSMSEKVKLLEKTNQEQSESLKKLENEILELRESLEQEKVKAKEADKNEKKRPSNFLELEIADYERSVKELNKQLKDAGVSTAELQSTLIEEKKKVENLEKELAQSRSDKDQDNELVNTLRTAIAENESRIAALQKIVDGSNTDKAALEGSIAQLKAQCDELRLEVADWTANCEKLTGSLTTAKENHLRKVRAQEERIRSLEEEKHRLAAQMKHLESEFTEYKNRAQVALKQIPSVSPLRQDSVSEAEHERLLKAVDVLKEKVEDLSAKLSSSNLEFITLREEKERQASRDAKLLEAADQRLSRLTADLNALREEYRVAMARLQGENQALVILHQERVSSMRAEHFGIEVSLKRQLESLQSQLDLKQMASRPRSSRKGGEEIELRTDIPIDTSLAERGQGEGSEDSSSSRKQPSPFAPKLDKKKSGPIPLDELLFATEPEPTVVHADSEVPLAAELEKLLSALELSERRVQHFTALLVESETSEARLKMLVDALKEEIRRIRRSEERQEHAENLEYLKNVVVKFITLPRGEERTRLIPVLQTILRLSPEEMQAVTFAVKEEERMYYSQNVVFFLRKADIRLGPLDAKENRLENLLRKRDDLYELAQQSPRNLHERSQTQKHCQTAKERQNNSVEKLEERNKAYPAASSKVEIKINDRVGRYAVATADIEAGEAVIIEDPTVAIQRPETLGDFCHGCFIRTPTPVPCQTCTSAGFCSYECRDRSYKLYHRLECHLLKLIGNHVLTADWLLALRSVIVDVEGRLRDFEEASSTTGNNFNLFCLESHSRDMPMNARAVEAYCAAFLVKCQWAVGAIDVAGSAGTERKMAALLFRTLQIAKFNTHSIMAQDSSGQTPGRMKVGLAIYPVLALLNHSCNPNVFKYFIGDRVYVVALRRIRKGEEISNCYGPRYINDNLSYRQKLLSTKFYFKCECEACFNEWPTKDDLNMSGAFEYGESRTLVSKSGTEYGEMSDDRGLLKKAAAIWMCARKLALDGSAVKAVELLKKVMKLIEDVEHPSLLKSNIEWDFVLFKSMGGN